MDVLESRHLLESRLAYAVAVAALHANSSADVSKGADTAYELYTRALTSIPYFEASTPKPSNERDEAVRKWKEMMEQERAQGTTETGK
jgi:hypothetical protein